MLFGGLGALFRLLSQVLEQFGILRCVKNFIKDLFEVGLVAEGPKCFVLVAKYDIFQDALSDSHQQRYLSVHLSTVLVDTNLLSMLVSSARQ